MKQGPVRKVSSHSTSQEIFRLLWKPKYHYRVQEPDSETYPEPDQSSQQPHTPVILIQNVRS